MDGSGDLLGVLALEREQTAFEEEDVFLVEAVAHQLAQAIERSRSSERLAFKETVATMTSWASDIAHDINSEVGQIRGNAYLIKLKSKGDEIVKYADQIDESAKSLTSVGPWSTQAKREILLDESLREFLKPLISQRNVELELDLCAPDVYIKVNPTEFQHVLRHLVRNSVRAMETFDAAKEKRIRVESRSLSDGRVEILFCDNGPGVDDDVRAAIFQRKATTKPVSDTNTVSGGYGLLISRQLVDDMNGKITLLPMEPGQGAVFSIKLPVVSPPYDVE
jgi:signal transduction histidine kinase